MASIIKLKRSSTGSSVPANSSLQAGELAINLADKKLYSANATGHTIQLSGDDFTVGTVADTDGATIQLTGTGNGSNSTVVLTGANGIGITSDGSGAITVTANTIDVDLATVANTSSANLVLSGGGESETVKLSGNNGLVVAATNTTNIVLENKGIQHTVTVNGSNKYVIDGTAQQALRLVPGVIYWFDQSDNSNSSHPLVFGTAANGSEVSQGTASGFEIYEKIGTPGAAGSYTRIKLQQDAPNSVYYFCSSHSGMGGSAYILPDNFYSNSTHVVATQPLSVTGVGTFSGNVSASHVIASGDVDITGEVNAATGAIVGAISIGGNTTIGGDADITGEVNAASAAIGGATISAAADIGARDLTLSGNLTVQGTTTTVQSTTVNINDNMLSLADNQTATDTDAVDIGFYGTFDAGGTDKYSGVFRDQNHSAKAFVFVEGITAEPGGTVTYNAANSSSSGSLAQIDAVIDGGSY
jgi:cytoskeletal protein CcmA (bactofilin family)